LAPNSTGLTPYYILLQNFIIPPLFKTGLTIQIIIYVVLQIDRTGDGLKDDRLLFEPRFQTGPYIAGIPSIIYFI
jgi:hypothetical protein